MFKKILICGASGLVGQAFIRAFLDEKNSGSEMVEYELYAASSHPEKIKMDDESLHKMKNENIENVLKNNSIDVLLQLAFPRNVKEEEWADGTKFALNLLFLAKKYNVKKMINVSSQSIYGLQRKRIAKETDPVVLNSPYTMGKCCTEFVTEQLFSRGSFTNIRLSTLIGTATKERVVNKFFANIIHGDNVIVQGGMQVFSFLDVRDAAQGLLTLIKHNEKYWRPVYNLGTSDSKTLLEIAQYAIGIGRKHGYSMSELCVIPGEIMLNNQIDTSAFETDFFWKAQHTIYDSMEYIFEKNISVI